MMLYHAVHRHRRAAHAPTPHRGARQVRERPMSQRRASQRVAGGGGGHAPQAPPFAHPPSRSHGAPPHLPPLLPPRFPAQPVHDLLWSRTLPRAMSQPWGQLAAPSHPPRLLREHQKPRVQAQLRVLPCRRAPAVACRARTRPSRCSARPVRVHSLPSSWALFPRSCRLAARKKTGSGVRPAPARTGLRRSRTRRLRSHAASPARCVAPESWGAGGKFSTGCRPLWRCCRAPVPRRAPPFGGPDGALGRVPAASRACSSPEDAQRWLMMMIEIADRFVTWPSLRHLASSHTQTSPSGAVTCVTLWQGARRAGRGPPLAEGRGMGRVLATLTGGLILIGARPARTACAACTGAASDRAH